MMIRLHHLHRLLLAGVLLPLLGGCAIVREFRPVVTMDSMTPGEYIAQQRGDILTTGKLSVQTAQAIRVSGLDADGCPAATTSCIEAMRTAPGLTNERRLSALSELWLRHALTLEAQGDTGDAQLGAMMEAARHAYAYLFFAERRPGERAFEDRQVQVRDWYNYAVQEASTLLFEQSRSAPGAPGQGSQPDTIHVAGWTFHIDLAGIRMPEGVSMPKELLPAASLSFTGFLSTWRREGFGAELVAVMEDDPITSTPTLAPTPAEDEGGSEEEVDAATARELRRRAPVWSEMPSPGLTVLFRFGNGKADAEALAAVLETREVRVEAHDPYAIDAAVFHGQRVPLAANFTAGYGLWLARSGFNKQSLHTLFGSGQGIERPHLYMMQPYDSNRRIILMLHGLASSPEAWVNLANEIQGDEELRRNYQIWQVYYPTNMPIVLNHAAIRRLVTRTLKHFDPDASAPASRDLVLIGHSMGGVIARLMVSTASDELQAWAEQEQRRQEQARKESSKAVAAEIDPQRQEQVRRRLERLLRFQPFPGIERAIFIATPHRGTAVAGQRLGRGIARLVRLPLTLLEGFGEMLPGGDGLAKSLEDSGMRLPNGIENLDEHDPFVRAAADLPISPNVRYHSIIAQADPSVPLEQSDDGLVPYRSAHLSGALSEKVITSGHSVQQTALSILEIRRILHLELMEQQSRP
ncbi:MAG: alpha/beta fold hydrolase [Thermomonas sp.]|uniref:esterase/lipase family protein n=1 Tax=Thermomonas sp. TaxID=1971895 RepID=UPI0039E604DC